MTWEFEIWHVERALKSYERGNKIQSYAGTLNISPDSFVRSGTRKGLRIWNFGCSKSRSIYLSSVCIRASTFFFAKMFERRSGIRKLVVQKNFENFFRFFGRGLEVAQVDFLCANPFKKESFNFVSKLRA